MLAKLSKVAVRQSWLHDGQRPDWMVRSALLAFIRAIANSAYQWNPDAGRRVRLLSGQPPENKAHQWCLRSLGGAVTTPSAWLRPTVLMRVNRGHRKAERKASARVWQGAVVAIAALILNGLLASISSGAGNLLRPVIDVLGWVIPVGLFAIALALVISGVWMIWRLRSNFRSVHDG